METAVTAEFADGTYLFRLPLPQMFALERAFSDGSDVLTVEQGMRGAVGLDGDDYVFLGGGSARIGDVRETIRLALIGGNHGMVAGEEIEVGPIRAKQLVDEYVCPARPLDEGLLLAWRILHALVFSPRLKKKADDRADENPSEKAS
jgi:hypothetical protein